MFLRALSTGLAGMAFLAATQLQPCSARPPLLPLNPIVNCASQEARPNPARFGIWTTGTGTIDFDPPVPEVVCCECPPTTEYCHFRRELIDSLLMGMHPAAALLPTRVFVQFEGPGFIPDLTFLRYPIARPQPQVPAMQFKPAGFINNWSGSGILPAGTFTPDLDIPVVNVEQLTVMPTEVEVLTVPPTEIDVVVPDGGTVIIGGRKFLSTGASEPVQKAIGYSAKEVVTLITQAKEKTERRARRMLTKAENHFVNGEHDLARKLYQRIQQLVPGTEADRQAAMRLALLAAKQLLESEALLRAMEGFRIGVKEEESTPEKIPAPKEVREIELNQPSGRYLEHPPQYCPPSPPVPHNEGVKRTQELRERGAAISAEKAPVCEIKRHPRSLEQVLYDPVTLNFCKVPLQKAIKEIANVMEIRLVVDEGALSEEGVNLDHPLTLKLEGISLKSTLKLLLEQARLAYVIKEESILVTTRARAAGPVVKKLYPVEDLISIWKKAQKPDEKYWTSDRLMELILHTTKPTWNIYGGVGTIDFWERGKQLIVCQTAEVHEQIEQLLGALRHEEKNRFQEMLLKAFSQAYKEGDYARAERAAMEALGLDPDSCAANAALMIVRKQLFEQVPAPKEVREVGLKLPSPFFLRHPPQYYPPPPLPSAHELVKRAQELRERGAAIGAPQHPTPPLPCVPSVEQVFFEQVQRMMAPRLIIEVQESHQVQAGCCDLLQMVGKKLLGSTCMDIDLTAGCKRAQGQFQLGQLTVRWGYANGKGMLDISICLPEAQESFFQRVFRWIEANASAGAEEQTGP